MTIRLVSTLDPRYNRRIESLPVFSDQDIFHIFDIFPDGYLGEMIQKKGRPACVLSDHILSLHSDHSYDLEFYGLPLWAMVQCRRWSCQDFDKEAQITTDFIFNFTVNKPQCSRFIMIKLIEINDLKNYQYTWSGAGRQFDMSGTINEMNLIPADSPVKSAQFLKDILAPIKLPAKYFTIDDKMFHQTDYKEIFVPTNGNIRWMWENLLGDIFEKSCISLISETGYYQKLSVFTEKTLCAFLGLTFPIWIGNWGQADAVSKLGLDVFDDVINHDYQWYPTLIERCYWAFNLNKSILSDLENARNLRVKHRERLLSNRDFLLNDGLGKYCTEKINSYPIHYQSHVMSVKHKFDKLRYR